MNRCPACGLLQPDDEEYCPADGRRLQRASADGHPTPLLPSGCSGCGASLVPGGACPLCGRPTEASPSGQAASLGPFRILKSLTDDELVVVDAHNTPQLVLVGAEDALAREATAAQRVAAQQPLVPAYRGLHTDAERGVFAVLEAPPRGAELLREVAGRLSLEQALAIVRAAAALAAHEPAWSPRLEDFLWTDEGQARLVRLRLSPHDQAHGGWLQTLGQALLPWPAAMGSERLVRALLSGEGMERHLDDDRGEPVEASYATRSHVGLCRAQNQDAVAERAEGEAWRVLVVCDGVSASDQSARAAQLVADEVASSLAELARELPPEASAQEGMEMAIRKAHRKVCDESPSWPAVVTPPGSTVVAALVRRQRVTIGWAGDSRAYWFGPDTSRQLTHDHSWVNEVIDSGMMSEEEALASPSAHAITRCVGPLEGEDMGPDTTEVELKTAGWLLLCTDGLWNYLPTPALLGDAVRRGPSDADLLARTLIHVALSRGGLDNISVALCRLPG